VVSVTADSGRAVLVELDIGRNTLLLARITERASDELALVPDKPVWALIKAVSLRGHAFSVPD
jgi:molybdopterin-binding protein